jgi:hypothetical protein
LIVIAACRQAAPVTWDPNGIVIEKVYYGGYFDRTGHERRIPMRLRGDGTIVWHEQRGSDGSRVLSGKLAEPQMRALLEKTRDAGFFSWPDIRSSATDQGSTCVSITTHEASGRVCGKDRPMNAPAAWAALLAELDAGAGAEPKPFVPPRAWLSAVRRPLPPARAAELPEWPAGAAGVSLTATLETGAWLEGAPLAEVWRLVYERDVKRVRDGGEVYDLVLRAPGVTMTEPP